MLLTFASLAPTSPLPQPVVSLLSAAPVPLLLPTATTKRQLKNALAAWQRPQHFMLSTTMSCLTPFLFDLLSLSPSSSAPTTLSSLPGPDEWSYSALPPSVGETVDHMVAPVQYAMEQLRLYESAYAISNDFTAHVQEQFRHVHAFNLRFVPLLPVSPYRFTVDPEVQARFPVMRVPTNHHIHITNNHADAERAIGHLLRSLPAQQPIIGLDTESRPMFKAGEPNRPTSLIQLSSLSVSVLCRVRRELGLPPALVRLLVDPKVRKVGQGIGTDMKLLHKQYVGTEQSADATMPESLVSTPSAHGFVDLESLSTSYSIHKVGLQSLTAAFLSLRLSKAAQLSNWERHSLTPEQVSYAALDSLVSLKLAQRMERVKDEMLAVARGWVEKEKGGGGDVTQERVWRWLTGNGPGMMDERDEKKEGEVGAKDKEQHVRKPRHTKKQKLESAASRAAQPSAPNGSQKVRKPRSFVRKPMSAHNSRGGEAKSSGNVTAVDSA